MRWRDFTSEQLAVGDARLFFRRGGEGPPLLLLHGFPETHLMWRDIAPRLAMRFSVVAADLTGYGASSCPPAGDDHARYGKRAMAEDMRGLMAALGHDRFAVAGHDRGGRVAYRLALDRPAAVTHVAVLDVVPGAAAWDRADARLTLGFWPWSLLAQPAPLPERLLGAAPEAVIDDALHAWGSAAGAFPRAVRAAYVAALSGASHVHAICEEYRAAATLDRAHDAADRAAGRRIACPLLALWSAVGALGQWYEGEGGPLALWRDSADDVQGEGVPGGHFFPEEHPRDTAERLVVFFESGTGPLPRPAAHTVN